MLTPDPTTPEQNPAADAVQTDADFPALPGLPAGGGAAEPPPGQAPEPLQDCLYFLVCQASSGPLAGLFKLGISSRLAGRYQQHTKNWQEFDLERSALVRLRSRDEAHNLEKILRRIFGAPKLEAAAKASGKVLSSAELRAAGSCRRHPGGCADGWTEFYTAECYDEMIETAEHVLTRWRRRGASGSWQRGLTPADFAQYVWTEGDALRDLDRGPGSRKRKEALRRQERDELQAQAAVKMGEVLDFALAHEQDLRWVSLRWWRYMRALARNGYCAQEGLVDLYFGPFGPAPAGGDADSAHRSAAQVRFEESFAHLDPVAGPAEPHGWRWTRTQQVYCLQNLLYEVPYPVPHPLCADTLLLRVEPVLSNLRHPLFERFEALAHRVESRLAREQMTFC